MTLKNIYFLSSVHNISLLVLQFLKGKSSRFGCTNLNTLHLVLL